jgi:hypothetical protein
MTAARKLALDSINCESTEPTILSVQMPPLVHILKHKINHKITTMNRHRHEVTYGYCYPKLGLAYLDIPKNASTSIKEALRTISQGEPPKLVELEHLKSNGELFVFTFVRNPWDRLVSCWADKIRHLNRTDREYDRGVYRDLLKDNGKFYGGMSFREFVFEILKTSDEKSDIHVRSQSSFIFNACNQSRASFIGRFENLQNDWLAICKKLDIDIKLPHKHYVSPKVSRKHYSAYYCKETQKLISTRYGYDIETFNYSFESKSMFEKVEKLS